MFKYIIFSFFFYQKEREKNENVRLLANCFKKLKEQLKLKTKETDIMTKCTSGNQNKTVKPRIKYNKTPIHYVGSD